MLLKHQWRFDCIELARSPLVLCLTLTPVTIARSGTWSRSVSLVGRAWSIVILLPMQDLGVILSVVEAGGWGKRLGVRRYVT